MARTDPQEHEERVRLADMIDRRADDVIERWLAQVNADAAGKHVSVTDLRDGVHDYLKRLASVLRTDEPLEGIGAATWSDVAREHALTRMLGFDVSQLTHELVVLRCATNDVVKEESRARNRHGEPLLELIDDAMKSTLRSYLDFRDYESRRTEAEHIGFLTHELKNPLGAVVLAIEQLRQQELAPGGRRLCDILERNVERIRRMIDDVMLSERLGVGEVENRAVDLTVRQLVEDLVATFKQAASHKRIAFTADYDPELRLHADPNLTASAIENLLDNAIKFTDAGEVTFVVEEAPDEVVFHVRDQCNGLSADELRVIFEPFKRARSAKPGTGLGLAIARRAIETQGGTMHAESSGASGCHFWFTLPKTHH